MKNRYKNAMRKRFVSLLFGSFVTLIFVFVGVGIALANTNAPVPHPKKIRSALTPEPIGTGTPIIANSVSGFEATAAVTSTQDCSPVPKRVTPDGTPEHSPTQVPACGFSPDNDPKGWRICEGEGYGDASCNSNQDPKLIRAIDRRAAATQDAKEAKPPSGRENFQGADAPIPIEGINSLRVHSPLKKKANLYYCQNAGNDPNCVWFFDSVPEQTPVSDTPLYWCNGCLFTVIYSINARTQKVYQHVEVRGDFGPNTGRAPHQAIKIAIGEYIQSPRPVATCRGYVIGKDFINIVVKHRGSSQEAISAASKKYYGERLIRQGRWTQFRVTFIGRPETYAWDVRVEKREQNTATQTWQEWSVPMYDSASADAQLRGEHPILGLIRIEKLFVGDEKNGDCEDEMTQDGVMYWDDIRAYWYKP